MTKRKLQTISQTVDYNFKKLERLTRNLLIDNINFKTGYYFRPENQEHRTQYYVKGPLRDQAEAILDEIESLRNFVCNVLQENKWEQIEEEARQMSEFLNQTEAKEPFVDDLIEEKIHGNAISGGN